MSAPSRSPCVFKMLNMRHDVFQQQHQWLWRPPVFTVDSLGTAYWNMPLIGSWWASFSEAENQLTHFLKKKWNLKNKGMHRMIWLWLSPLICFCACCFPEKGLSLCPNLWLIPGNTGWLWHHTVNWCGSGQRLRKCFICCNYCWLICHWHTCGKFILLLLF